MYPYHWEMAHKRESARLKERKETLDNSMDAAQITATHGFPFFVSCSDSPKIWMQKARSIGSIP